MNYLLSISASEGDILIWIQNNIRQEWLTPIMKFITSLGNAGIIWIVLSILLLCIKKTRKVGIMCAMALILSLIVNNLILKPIVARTRPYEVIPDLKLLVKKEVDYSFPSGHTGSSFAAGVVMLLKLPKKWGIPAFILAVTIALSRLYVGVHYPTDVLGGAVTGTVCGIAACLIYAYIERKNKKINTV